MIFLHRLQQRRLRARAGAVDLVRHQQLREHRAFDKTERAAADRPLFQHFRAENIGGHQVGRELHAARIKPEHNAQCLDQLGFREAGHADEQAMAASQHSHQRLLDNQFLPENDRANRRFGRRHLGQRGFGALDHCVLKGSRPACLRHAHSSSLRGRHMRQAPFQITLDRLEWIRLNPKANACSISVPCLSTG